MLKRKEPTPVWKSSISGTPLRTITCSMTQAGLAGLVFGYGPEAEDHLPEASGPVPHRVSYALQNTLDQLAAYLNGLLKEFDIPLDLSNCTDFQKRVLQEVIKIPCGQVTTYGQIASLVGGARYMRAVGGAVGGNPIPLVIPCHRVVSSDGHLRGYSGWGGIRTKAWLLRLEGQQLIAED